MPKSFCVMYFFSIHPSAKRKYLVRLNNFAQLLHKLQKTAFFPSFIIPRFPDVRTSNFYCFLRLCPVFKMEGGDRILCQHVFPLGIKFTPIIKKPNITTNGGSRSPRLLASPVVRPRFVRVGNNHSEQFSTKYRRPIRELCHRLFGRSSCNNAISVLSLARQNPSIAQTSPDLRVAGGNSPFAPSLRQQHCPLPLPKL